MAVTPSPHWREQLVYFLLPDRFSDGREKHRELLGADAPADAASRVPPDWDGPLRTWYWNQWAISGRNRFQGGTIPGITSKLGYLADLGVTALWLGPVWKQRATGVDQNTNVDGTDDPYFEVNPADLANPERSVDFRALELSRDEYHGYAIQDFGAVDPRFGTTNDLVALVSAAHKRGMYVIFDMMINHSGENFAYDVPLTSSVIRPHFRAKDFRNAGDPYPFGAWLDRNNRPMSRGASPGHRDDGVWPAVLQDAAFYSRQGAGSYSGDEDGSPAPEFRVADYRNRDFAYPPEQAPSPVLDAMVTIWCDWIDRTDCDGFRVDTFKHVPPWVAKEFVDRVRAHAAARGKSDFLVMGEVGGGEKRQADYLVAIPKVRILELDERRRALRGLAYGDPNQVAAVLTPPAQVDGTDVDAQRLVMSVDDHDGLGIDRQVRLAGAGPDLTRGRDAVLPAAAFLMFGPSIPCLYYGTEQALCGPVGMDGNLDDYGLSRPGTSGGQQGVNRGRGGDRYLREAMFGPLHPRKAGVAGRPPKRGSLRRRKLADPDLFDRDLPGFGPRGTSGFHVFDRNSPWYQGISALATVRRAHPVLATGTIRRLTGGRVDGGRFAGGTLPRTTVAWWRQDDTGWAVIVVDVASGGPPYDIDLALPGNLGGATRVVEAVRIRDGKTTRPGVLSALPVMPQTGTPYLPLGPVAPGDVRVYLSAR